MERLHGNATGFRAPDGRLVVSDSGVLLLIQVGKDIRQIVGGCRIRLLGELSRNVDHNRRIEALILAHPC